MEKITNIDDIEDQYQITKKNDLDDQDQTNKKSNLQDQDQMKLKINYRIHVKINIFLKKKCSRPRNFKQKNFVQKNWIFSVQCFRTLLFEEKYFRWKKITIKSEICFCFSFRILRIFCEIKNHLANFGGRGGNIQYEYN